MKPITFNSEMVRAILAGRKTQTRRPIKSGNPHEAPRFLLGEKLYVQETWADVNTTDGPAIAYRGGNGLHFCADDAFPVEYERYPGCQFSMWYADLNSGDDPSCEWREANTMPRWAARVFLEVTGVRVERLQEISIADLEAEGVLHLPPPFVAFWDSIYSKTFPWESNPWVFVYDFKLLSPVTGEAGE